MKLVALGFSPAASRMALKECKGNAPRAAEWLLNEANLEAIRAADAIASHQSSDTPMKIDEDDSKVQLLADLTAY